VLVVRCRVYSPIHSCTVRVTTYPDLSENREELTERFIGKTREIPKRDFEMIMETAGVKA